MEAPMDLHFDGLCRTCMHEVAEADVYGTRTRLKIKRTPTNRKAQSIFETASDCEALTISEMLISTTPQIKVQLSDGLPKKICCECLGHLLSAYRFQQLCIQSDQQMRELIANGKAETFPIQDPITIGDIAEAISTFNTESPSPVGNDPLQNVTPTAAGEPCKTPQVDVNDYLKMELNVDDFNDNGSIADCNDNEMNDLKPDVKVTGKRVTQTADEENSEAGEAANSDGDHSDWANEVNLKTCNTRKECKRKDTTKKTAAKTKRVQSSRKAQKESFDSATHNCTLCQKTFETRRYLQKHLRRHKKWDGLKNAKANSKSKTLPIQDPITLDDTAVHISTFHTEPASQAIGKDPLQNVDAAVAGEPSKTPQVDVKDYLKIELNVDDFNDNASVANCNDIEMKDLKPDVKGTGKRVAQTADTENSAASDAADSDGDHSDWENEVNLKTCSTKKECKQKDITKKTAVKTKKVQSSRKPQKESLVSTTHNCTLCQKTFETHRYLQRHLRRHKKWDELKNMPAKPDSDGQHLRFKCDICGRFYNKPESLYQHRLTHVEENVNGEKSISPYICNICEKVYGSQRTLTRHKRQRHCVTEEIRKEAAKLHTCEFCNKSFYQSGTLKDHLRTHTGEQPYLCSECGKAFNSASNMKQHLLRHAGVKRYECPHCPKKFPCLSDLASHKAVHGRHRPHICDICGSAFAQPYHLKRHKMYHNGDKPYKCEYCEMRFICMDHQRRHMRTHTGEKPYKCNYCERAFAQSNDLIKHLRSHLGENVYRCELCPCAFRMATELRVHFAMHKNEDEETRERNKKALMAEETRLRLKVMASNKVQNLANVEQSFGKREPNVTTVVLD